jgi:hypothetical protein
MTLVGAIEASHGIDLSLSQRASATGSLPLGGQPGKPKPPGKPPDYPDDDKEDMQAPIEEPPMPIPGPPVERPPAPMR